MLQYDLEFKKHVDVLESSFAGLKSSLVPFPFMFEKPDYLFLNTIKQNIQAFNEWQINALKKIKYFSEAKHFALKLSQYRSSYIDSLLLQWIDTMHSEQEESHYLLIATGGYGRQILSLYSDIDLLFIFDEEDTLLASKELVVQLTQFLWDVGLEPSIKTHCVSELLQIISSDIQFETSLIFRRLIKGSELKYNAIAVDKYEDKLLATRYFAKQKIIEQSTRHRLFQDTSYHLEPHLLKTPGGLRDIHLIYWIQEKFKNNPQLSSYNQLVYAVEAVLKEYECTLILLRFCLHSITTKKEDRLLFMHQLTIAQEYNFIYEDTELLYNGSGQSSLAEVNKDVEKLMKQFYQTAAGVTLQNIIFIKQINETIKQIELMSCFYHFSGALIPKTKQSKLVALDIIRAKWIPGDSIKQFKNQTKIKAFSHPKKLKKDNLSLINPSRLLKKKAKGNDIGDVDELLTLLEEMVKYKLTLDVLDYQTAINLSLVNLPDCETLNIETRKRFFNLLIHPSSIYSAIRLLHQLGIFWDYYKGWSHVSGLMQFDRFHAYTVDEHTIQVLLNIESFANANKEDLVYHIFSQLKYPHRLKLAALFHDIGKGKKANHSEVGGEIFNHFALLHDINFEDREEISWLIRNHLIFSVTAQRKDISDTYLLKALADNIATKERLAALYLLTVADIKGTHYALLSNWKKSLLDELYFKIEVLLENNQTVFKQIRSSIRNKQLDALTWLNKHHGLTLSRTNQSCVYSRAIMQFWRRCRVDYFIYHNGESLAWHVDKLLMKYLCKSENITNDSSYKRKENDECENIKNQNDRYQIGIITHYNTVKKQNMDLSKTAVLMTNQLTPGATELFIWTKDKDNLFAAIVSTIDKMNLSVLQAQIFTQKDNMAMDTFILSQRDNRPLALERQLKLKNALLTLLKQPTLPIPPAKRAHYVEAHFSLVSQITMTNHPLSQQTEIEIMTLDRPGLLVLIANEFAKLSLRVIGAKIMTVGEKIEDMFLLSTHDRKALTKDMQALLKQNLIRILDSYDA